MMSLKNTYFISIVSVVAGCALATTTFASSEYAIHSHGGIHIKDLNDTDIWFKLGGGMQFDALMFDSTGANIAAYPNGMNIRSARLDLRGGVGKDWAYKFETDFGQASQNQVQILDAFLGYTGFRNAYIAFGQISQPLGMENWMSPNNAFFMERSLVVGATDPEYGIGVYGDMQRQNFSMMVALYSPREGVGQSGGSLTSGSDPYGVSGRAVWSPYHGAEKVIHVGLSSLYQDTHLRTTQVSFSTVPEMMGRVNLTPYTTGTLLNTSNYNINGVEAALQWHRWTGMFEYQHIHLDRNKATAGGDVSFQGYSMTGSYALKGEKRTYDLRSGTFGGMRSTSKQGAWELVARYSYLDLGDDNAAGQHVGALGSVHNLGGGVNWWYNDMLRFSFNTIYSNQSEGIELMIFGLRGQVSWN